jgi:cell division protein FtsB
VRSRPARDEHEGPFTMRGWLIVVGGLATGAVILAAWFPVGALLSQRAQLAATSSRLAQLTAEGRVVAAETKQLSSPVILSQLAREEYQLVEPGQRLILVESPSFKPSAKSFDGPYPGDPGFAPLVNPDTSSIAPDGISGSSSMSAHADPPGGGSAVGGFFSRVVSTLEFWR